MPLSGTIYERRRLSAEDTCHFRDQLSSCMNRKKITYSLAGSTVKKGTIDDPQRKKPAYPESGIRFTQPRPITSASNHDIEWESPK